MWFSTNNDLLWIPELKTYINKMSDVGYKKKKKKSDVGESRGLCLCLCIINRSKKTYKVPR